MTFQGITQPGRAFPSKGFAMESGTEFAMKNFATPALAAALWFVAALVGPSTGAPTPEIRRLHALIVIDTQSDLRDSIIVDKARIESLLARTIPKDRYDATTLVGGEVTRERVLAYYRNLKADRSDALLFYYAGHGAVDPTRGQYFYFQKGKTDPLFRSVLRQAILQKQAGLSILLTDCCSNHLKVPNKRRRSDTAAPAKDISPVARCLLFQARGIVDITAASDNAAWGDDQDGGIFTRTVARLVLGDADRLDTDRDGFVSWKEFFARLDLDVQRTFATWARQAKARGEVVDQSTQRPHAYSVPGMSSSASERSFAVVGLRNATSAAVHYQYRWSTEDSWRNGAIPPKSASPCICALAGGVEQLPYLQIRVDGADKPARLEAKRWTGSGLPSYENGAKYKVAEKSRKLRQFDVEPTELRESALKGDNGGDGPP
jgi:hypothetical protein